MFQRLEGVIAAEMERARVPGLAIALVKGSEIVWAKGYGYADLEEKVPVSPSTVFSVQSVTKPVVTTALMQWYDRGRFHLDDPANNHLAPVRLQNEWEETAPVTIRQLLTHTAGLPVDLGATPPPPGGGAYPLEDYVSKVVKTVAPPGGEIVYANWGYATTGYLAGRFAGRPYDEYLRREVLEPLGMGSSRIGRPPEGAVAARGYFLSALDGRHHAPAPFPWLTEPADPAGSLYSTVEDLGRFLVAHLNGGVFEGRRILSERSTAEMHRLHARAGASVGGMGLGFRVDVSGGRSLFCHGGDGPTFTAFVGAYPQERVGVALLMNMGRAQGVRSVVAGTALRALVGEDERRDEGRARAAGRVWERRVGLYQSSYWDISATLTAEEGRAALTVEGPMVAAEEGETSYLYTRSDGVAVGRGGVFDGFELTFEAGPDGRAARFFGGLYPWRFDRTGDVPAAGEMEVDEDSDLAGRWTGTASSPLGPLPLALDVAGPGAATVTALSAHDAPVQEFRIGRGRLSGQVEVSLPGFGDIRVYMRLKAVAGKLRGRAYAQGNFGEVSMPTELARE